MNTIDAIDAAPEFTADCASMRVRVEAALDAHLPTPPHAPARLCAAMRYACLNGGKRFRAILVYAGGGLGGATPRVLDAPAAAIEMMHAYSLVHDDLPAMDDDAMRRNQPSCHIQFDEATAILAGDALQTRAFEVLSEAPQLSPTQRVRMVVALSNAAGAYGMAGGQSLDIDAGVANRDRGGNSNRNGNSDSDDNAKRDSYSDSNSDDDNDNDNDNQSTRDAEQLTRIHRLKTGALIRAAAALGALASPDEDMVLLEALCNYADNVGLAFQIADDILDADEPQSQPSYATHLGKTRAQHEARRLSNQAVESLDGLGDNATDRAHLRLLQQLAQFAVQRDC